MLTKARETNQIAIRKVTTQLIRQLRRIARSRDGSIEVLVRELSYAHVFSKGVASAILRILGIGNRVAEGKRVSESELADFHRLGEGLVVALDACDSLENPPRPRHARSA